jgi:hypothetical protein
MQSVSLSSPTRGEDNGKVIIPDSFSNPGRNDIFIKYFNEEEINGDLSDVDYFN